MSTGDQMSTGDRKNSGSKLAGTTVELAARLLPARIRDRYREQWRADLRDAAAVGIRPSEIAIGSLVFAATVSRSGSIALRRPTAEIVAGRGRIAAGLAVSSALLGLSQYGSTAGIGESLSGNAAYDFFYFVTFTLLGLYAIVAPIAAVVIVSFTRGMDARIRLAVWLLFPIGLTQFVQVQLDLGNYQSAWGWNSPGASAYLVALAITIVAALVLRGRVGDETELRAARAVTITAIRAASVAAAAVAAGLITAQVLWSHRLPLRFGLPRNTANGTTFRDWLLLKHYAEQQVSGVFTAVLIGGIALVLLVFSLCERAHSARAAIMVAATAVSTVVIATGTLLGYLELMEQSVAAPAAVGLLLFLGRLGLVGAILYGLRVRSALPWTSPRSAPLTPA